MSDVRERPSDIPLHTGPRGKTTGREFTVYAASKVVAERKLRAFGIRRGLVFNDPLGNRPDPFLRVESIDITPDGIEVVGHPENAYVATVMYRSLAISRNGLELYPNGPAIESVEHSTASDEADVDIDGNPVQNAAGVPFPDPLKTTRRNEVLHFEWIRTDLSFLQAEALSWDYANSLNAQEFIGAPKHCLKCLGLGPVALTNEAFSGPGPVKFDAKFEFRPRKELYSEQYGGFIHTRLNMGKSERNPDYDPSDPQSSPTRPILEGDYDDDNRRQIQTPIKLDSDGYVMQDQSQDPVVLSFRSLPELNFQDIRIPFA